MEKMTILKKDIYNMALATFCLILVIFIGGYFVGRYEQIQINKSLLRPIPDVNCH